VLMDAFFALLPILSILLAMLVLGWSGQRAGFIGWLISIFIGYTQFGLTPQVFWVSQAKGVYFSLFVLAIVWPALLLYHVVRQAGGIQAITDALQTSMQDRGLLLIGMAWAFSGMLEGLAGFGLPIAVVAPILVGLGVQPALAVAAAAIGHSWSVTFGDMGVIFQTLVKLTAYDPGMLIPPAAGMLGLACLGCGLGTMLVLGQSHLWYKVVLTAAAMGMTQYALASIGLIPLSALGAGLVGMALLALWSHPKRAVLADPQALWVAISSYGGLAAILTLLTATPPIHATLSRFALTLDFDAVRTNLEHYIPTSTQTLYYFLHPGFTLTIVAAISYTVCRKKKFFAPEIGSRIAVDTWRAAAPTSLGVLFMVGLSTLMDHTGMMLILAQTLSRWVGIAFPLVSPWIGTLGAFATGSNNNSNVMFAVLQQNTAQILNLSSSVIIAAQTAGGALGSMIAPAKLILGCTTAGIKNKQGEVLRLTLPYGLGIGLALGIIAFCFS
jgi:lactate permease